MSNVFSQPLEKPDAPREPSAGLFNVAARGYLFITGVFTAGVKDIGGRSVVIRSKSETGATSAGFSVASFLPPARKALASLTVAVTIQIVRVPRLVPLKETLGFRLRVEIRAVAVLC